MNYIFYHRGCQDGYGAQYAVWKVWGWTAMYVAVNYDDNFGGIAGPLRPNDTVVVADFCFPLEVIKTIAARCHWVTILDHHATAEPIMAEAQKTIPNVTSIYDVTRAGSLIAWNYFHLAPAPMLIQHISDRDLWEFKVPNTAEFSEGLWAAGSSMDTLDKIATNEAEYLRTIENGIVLLKTKKRSVDGMVQQAIGINVDGHDVPVVNAGAFRSEVCHALLELYPDAPFAGVYQDLPGGERRWSFRARKGGFDVSKLCEKYGGGGHAQASGVGTERPQLLFP